MAVGIIIHVSVGAEKRTEFFAEENIRFGTNETCDLQIHSKKIAADGVWLELELENNVYRIIRFNEKLGLTLNGKPIHRFEALEDGDIIDIPLADISFSFFSLESKSSLITTNREQPHIAPFIEEAAIGASFSPERDDAKAFLREFVRELSREISWITKLVVLAIVIGSIGGLLYLGFAFNRELQKNRQQAEQQNEIVRLLQERIAQTNNQIGEIDKTNKDIIKTVSLTSNLRVEYGNGVCLIVGVYDLVDRKNGKMLRYPNPQDYQPSPYEPAPMEEGITTEQAQMGLTTEGTGSPVEYDFIGTGFHVGNGYIVTNRHVVQPWEEDDLVKQMMRDANGRARIKRLVIYFPNFPQPFPLKVRQLGSREDLAIGVVDANLVSPDIPVLPLEMESEAISVGKTVVTMGYPSGPERLLAMVDDNEAKSINARYGNSRQSLINFLAQSRKIVPLTTQGAITDLDARRIVHDAKTAEGGSGAPLFGQTGKVIGVNFGVFTENNAANMALPIRFAFDLLKRVGWKSPEEMKIEAAGQNQTASANMNTSQPKAQ
ncbi:MAG: trypsin-like peptidase domain-containing protein [Acidobacteria bacterium]|nr:trypsin-like peptidase domain-containing protein [Acidobacteriota bacterium]MCA1638083.1 trypsin-like peptidase domain-containing protein [Acidobacteriota bacterium]